MDSSTHTPDTQPEASPSVTVLWLYIFGFVVCSVVVFLLPAPYSLYLLVVLVAASMGFGIYRLIRAARPPRPRAPAPPPVSETVSAAVTAVPVAPQAPARRAPAALSRLSAYRSGFAAVFALAGFALMIAAAFDYRTLNDQAYLADGSLKMIAGGLMIGGAVRVSRRLPALNEPVAAPLDHLRRFWWVFAGLGALFLMTLAEINGQMRHIPALQEVPTPLQFGLLVGGVLLLGYGFGGAPSLNPLRIRIVWSTVIPLGAILALALFLRAWQNDVSLTYLLDELHYSDAVLGLEGRPYQPILTPMSGQATDPWVYPFLVTNTVAVLGHTFAG
ncbi:MAG: hypothetical protein IT319_10380, partial [Anaerolineae bacterium]|nr:hypothetical protein [Anaerolineae bacterium]